MNLVVGATGMLGSEICRRLTAAGKPVRALVRATSDQAKVDKLKGHGVELVQGVEGVPSEGCAAIVVDLEDHVHACTEAHVDPPIRPPASTARLTRLGTGPCDPHGGADVHIVDGLDARGAAHARASDAKATILAEPSEARPAIRRLAPEGTDGPDGPGLSR